MKKVYILLLAALLAVALCACGGESQAEQVITRSTEATTVPVVSADTEPAEEAVNADFAVFQVDGYPLEVGTELDLSKLPEANSVYQVPSCAIEGTDNVYRYDSFEITAYDDGTCEQIYSVYFVTPDAATPEGLTLGESLDRVLELYGEKYEQDGTAFYYYSGDAMLCILVQNDVVISIEYRMVTE